MNTIDLRDYYANTLVLQYIGKDRAYATLQATATALIMAQVSTQTIGFTLAPTSGAFTLFYGLLQTASINWNDSQSTVQSKIQALSGLGSVTVVTTPTLWTITFTGVVAPANLLVLGANSLMNGGNAVIPVITETDITLPLAVQNAFNVIGPNPAEGVQLDVIGKYVGVTRTSQGFSSQITLDDTDFRSLIQIATIENNAGSSTATIVGLLNQFFPGQIFLFDRQTMEFDYYLASTVGSMDLVQVFIAEGKLPKPMGVRIRLIIYAPIVNRFFGFRTYEAPAFNTEPFNNYSSYNLTWPWLTYADAIVL